MTKKRRLLIVEDDVNLGQLLNEYLVMKGYETQLCRDGEEGIATFKRGDFDLCILDVMMPKKDGFTLSKEIRKHTPEIPFIFLTAKSMKDDAIKGLKLGADDYMTKPFSMEELLLRLEAIFRRTQPGIKSDPVVFKFKTLSFDSNLRLLTVNNSKQKLTSKESELLKMLLTHKNVTLSRKKALDSIWKDDSYFNSRSMDVYITKLRKYLKAAPELEILTVHGEGFRLVSLA